MSYVVWASTVRRERREPEGLGNGRERRKKWGVPALAWRVRTCLATEKDRSRTAALAQIALSVDEIVRQGAPSRDCEIFIQS